MKKLYWGLLFLALGLIPFVILFEVMQKKVLVNILAIPLVISALGSCILYLVFIKFRCPKCNTVFKGKFWQIFIAPHTPTKRWMPCPQCNQWLWCDDVFEKNK